MILRLQEFSQGESIGEICKEEKCTASFELAYTRADCGDVQPERLDLGFVVVFSKLSVLYILKT